MKRKIITILVFCIVCSTCIAQKKILYSFEKPVNDSIQIGLDMFSSLLKKKDRDLKIYAVVIENNNEFEIFLQEYSQLPKSGLLELIKSTNRKIRINKTTSIPIVIPADKLSMQVMKDKIVEIPLSGYYIKVVYENYTQKVVQTSILF